ncbi:MAG: hypothetical protein AAGK97_06385, partial [Bacteroidota bacterium]
INIFNQLIMNSGNLDLNGFDLKLHADTSKIVGESPSSYITSTITGTDDHSDSGAVQFNGIFNQVNTVQDAGGMGLSFKSPEPIGPLSIFRYPTNTYSPIGSTRIDRLYEIEYTNQTNTLSNPEEIEITLEYFDHELNGATEADLRPFVSTDLDPAYAIERVIIGKDEVANTITYNGLSDDMMILPAESGANGQMIWTGALDTDWHNPGNWQIYGVPNFRYDVIVPDTANDPIINTHPYFPSECKNIVLQFGAVLKVLTELNVVGI